MARKPFESLSPKYRARIERAIAKGKTLQQARGHREKEHVYRKEREIERDIEETGFSFGLSKSQADSIRAHISRRNDKTLEAEDIVDHAREFGWEWFKNYRDVWTRARRQYLRDLSDGSYASQGLQYLEGLAVQADASEVSWLYYH